MKWNHNDEQVMGCALCLAEKILKRPIFRAKDSIKIRTKYAELSVEM